MFFRKDIFNIKPATLEPEAETAEDEVRNPPSDTRPVYVIGDNALTCYLAAKLTDAGHDVIVIAGKENNLSFSTNGISLKEDSSLKLSRYKFNTSFWIKEEPKLVIIAADAGHVNASLAAVAKDKIARRRFCALRRSKTSTTSKPWSAAIFSGPFSTAICNRTDSRFFFTAARRR